MLAFPQIYMYLTGCKVSFKSHNTSLLMFLYGCLETYACYQEEGYPYPHCKMDISATFLDL